MDDLLYVIQVTQSCWTDSDMQTAASERHSYLYCYCQNENLMGLTWI